MSNIFAQESQITDAMAVKSPRTERIPNYIGSSSTFINHVLSFVKGFVAGFCVLFIFYRIPILCIIGGSIIGFVNIFVGAKEATIKRRQRLRVQFFDLLEAMTISMRAGNPPLRALESAREDLAIIYPKNSDIIVEVELMIGRFNNGVPLPNIFNDFAERSNIEDIASFASVYATIDGKSSRADQVVRETQQIIADKMEIEMEISTLMTAAKSEVNIMLVMPLVILGVIGYAGAGFMDAIYTTVMGRIVATGGFIVFIVSFIMARVFSNIKL